MTDRDEVKEIRVQSETMEDRGMRFRVTKMLCGAEEIRRQL